jgi:signal transduction histidine kinase
VLGNAIKYSGEGSSIHIGLHISNGRPICTIKDEGVGIKDEDLNHVFDSFFRSDALNHKHISGNGLGLAIAKKCADAICAELKVTSTYGQGTEVIISF